MIYSQEIEQLFLGCLLYKPELYDDVSYIKPEFFFYEQHDRIYRKIVEFIESGKKVIPQQIQKEVELPDNYISDLINGILGTSQTKQYAELIYDYHCKRAIEKLGDNLKNLANDKEIKAKNIIADTEKFINNVYDIKDDTINHISHNIDKAINEIKNPTFGIRTGISALDKKTKGFKGSNLYIIAARPGMGKTALGITLALNSAFSNHKALFVTLEMPLIQLQERVLKRVTDIEQLTKLPLWIDDCSGASITDLITKARRYKRKNGLDILFIDYLGLISPDDKSMNKVHQIEDITTRCKMLAKELNIPVILLCQLSRAVELRDDKRPMLSDLRDSGSIEQDADLVAFIYREYYYAMNAFGANDKKNKYNKTEKNKNTESAQLADLEAIKDEADIIIAKNRHGDAGTIKLRFLADQQYFCD